MIGKQGGQYMVQQNMKKYSNKNQIHRGDNANAKTSNTAMGVQHAMEAY